MGSCEPLLEKLGEFLTEEEKEDILGALSEAIPAARPSELEAILDAGSMVTLPLHREETAEGIEAKLRSFKEFVAATLREGSAAAGLDSKPCAVTIARSVVDGFCPMRWCVHLEAQLLDILEGLLGQLEVVYSDELELLENGLR